MKKSPLWAFLLIPIMVYAMAYRAEACPACWAGYGAGAERFNKNLAELRALYEKQARDALPKIREILKTTNDPMVQQRALDYIVALGDVDSVPVLEDLLLDLAKRVAFTTFGVTLDPGPYQTRLKVAHSLAALGSTEVADRLWRKYSRMDHARKTEVPYILNALNDPKLCVRLKFILTNAEDYQLMIGALNVMAMGGDESVLPFLKSKTAEWKMRKQDNQSTSGRYSTVEYSVLKIKAEQAIFQIGQRTRN